MRACQLRGAGGEGLGTVSAWTGLREPSPPLGPGDQEPRGSIEWKESLRGWGGEEWRR